MGWLKEYSTAKNSFALASGFTAGNILTSTKSNNYEKGVFMSTLGISTTGLSTAKKIISELVKYEQAHGNKDGKKNKSFTLTQLLVLLELARKSKKGDLVKLQFNDLRDDIGLDGIDLPDFKVSRTCNALADGRDIAGGNAGWDLCSVTTSKENKRFQEISLNKKGLNLVRQLADL